MITVQADSCMNSEQIDTLFTSVGDQEKGFWGGGSFWAGGPKNAHDCQESFFCIFLPHPMRIYPHIQHSQTHIYTHTGASSAPHTDSGRLEKYLSDMATFLGIGRAPPRVSGWLLNILTYTLTNAHSRTRAHAHTHNACTFGITKASLTRGTEACCRKGTQRTALAPKGFSFCLSSSTHTVHAQSTKPGSFAVRAYSPRGSLQMPRCQIDAFASRS
jgi:hypothetical protein